MDSVMSWISYKPKDIEKKGIRPPRQKDEVDRNEPHPGFYRQGANGAPFMSVIPNPFGQAPPQGLAGIK